MDLPSSRLREAKNMESTATKGGELIVRKRKSASPRATFRKEFKP